MVTRRALAYCRRWSLVAVGSIGSDIACGFMAQQEVGPFYAALPLLGCSPRLLFFGAARTAFILCLIEMAVENRKP